MNRIISGLVIVIIVLIGCTDKDKAPGDVLSKEKMQAVLWDIIQAERFTATFVAKDSSKDIKLENFKLYDQIFTRHQVKKEEFIKSYEFYLSRPDIARVLFDSLAARANRVRDDMYKTPIQDSLADSPIKPTDSLKKADLAKISPAKPVDTQAIRDLRAKSLLLKPLQPTISPDSPKSRKPTLPAVKRDTSKAAFRKRVLLRTDRRFRDSVMKSKQ